MYRSLDPREMSADELTRMCKAERKRALAGSWTYDLARHRSYLNELHRRKRELCTYYLTTEMETRP
jgi:hypothetical protein